MSITQIIKRHTNVLFTYLPSTMCGGGLCVHATQKRLNLLAVTRPRQPEQDTWTDRLTVPSTPKYHFLGPLTVLHFTIHDVTRNTDI